MAHGTHSSDHPAVDVVTLPSLLMYSVAAAQFPSRHASKKASWILVLISAGRPTINLAVLADGRFVTCEKGIPRVKVYEVDGTLESVVAGPESFLEPDIPGAGPALDYSEGSLDVAIDSGGRIFVLDSVADNIRIMTRKSSSETTATGGTA